MRSQFDPSRRRVIAAGSLAGVAVVVPIRAAPVVAPATYTFLTPREAAFVEAAVARLIPKDELGPGALEAGVPTFVDRQLAGAFGAGARMYRSGPWRTGEPTQGYQLPDTPAELFRRVVRDFDVERFTASPGPTQDDLLRALEKDAPELFDSLLALTMEGFFGDPMYGGNRGMAGWRLVGFPGAYANYYDLVDRYGVAFPGPPVGIETHGHTHR